MKLDVAVSRNLRSHWWVNWWQLRRLWYRTGCKREQLQHFLVDLEAWVNLFRLTGPITNAGFASANRPLGVSDELRLAASRWTSCHYQEHPLSLHKRLNEDEFCSDMFRSEVRQCRKQSLGKKYDEPDDAMSFQQQRQSMRVSGFTAHDLRWKKANTADNQLKCWLSHPKTQESKQSDTPRGSGPVLTFCTKSKRP